MREQYLAPTLMRYNDIKIGKGKKESLMLEMVEGETTRCGAPQITG